MASGSRNEPWIIVNQVINSFLLGLGLGHWIVVGGWVGISLTVCALILMLVPSLCMSLSSATARRHIHRSSVMFRCSNCCSLTSPCPLSRLCAGTNQGYGGQKVEDLSPASKPHGPLPFPSSDSEPGHADHKPD